MDENDPLQTRRDVLPFISDELREAGFDDAREIGRGGFGVVYRCTQAGLDRTVAVKVLTADLDEENRARFFREQRAMGRLTGHPNIVGVLQVGTTDTGRPYLVMPYHRQGSVDTKIRENGPLDLEEVLRLGVKMAGALETAHRLGILHRDVKPANILLTDYGEPALTDFGIAHIADGFKTATGTVTGSPAFTAPEVLGGEPPSPASDVYGLGATLFSALTGHAAFERRSGEQVVAQFLRITAQPVPDMREHGFPDDVCAVIEKAMSRDPGDRPSTSVLGENLRELQVRRGLPVDEMALRAAPGADPRDPQPPSARWHPPASPVARKADRNLPLELTSFVGRRTELAEVKNLLSVSRLVTLTGIGGVGKTRLALRVASNVQRDFADGVWLVELGELHDESLVVGAVAAELGVRDQSSRPLSEILVEFLATRTLLLVLDNCEQVIDAVAGLAEVLLRACPQLRILTTSREPLGIGGESVLRVSPLAVPDPDREPSLRGLPRYDALTLFAERAVAAVRGFEITEENKATVARICQRLEGLPLAIELAAARLRAMSPEQILQRLDDRYTLLTSGSRGAPTRQQTLRWSIDWSYDLCTPLEQQLWGRVSVFAGSFELDAAEEVCGDDKAPEGLLDALSSLVDKSILIREESDTVVHFRLCETLRDYGREKIVEAGEYEVLRRRHRDWYQQLTLDAAAGWISPRQLEWIDRLDRERPNIREALEFCLSDNDGVEAGLCLAAALFQFALSRGLYSECRHWLDHFLARDAGKPTAERIRAIHADSLLAVVQGDLLAATALIEEGRAIAAQFTDPQIHALLDHADGELALYRDDLPRAVSRLENALEVFGACGDLTLQVAVLQTLGLVYDLLGESQRSIGCYEKALSITESHGESVYRSYTLWAMGVAVWRQGDRGRAVGLLGQALQLAERVNDPLTCSACLEVLACIATEERNVRRAAVLMGAAEELAHSVGGVTIVSPNLLPYQEECETTARRALGEQAFGAAQREGRLMGMDGAVVYALGLQSPDVNRTAGQSTDLTKRESEVAELVAQGLTNKQIAARLVISPRTAQGHVEHILTKLGFNSRAQIAAWVVEQSRNEPA
jgi:predicted ATPase/serine/threonine protein kinase/DNA-binding NarL/FixJ family response regulator